MANYGRKLRKYLFERSTINTYIDFIDFKVFDAGVDTSIIVLNKQKNKLNYHFTYCRINNDLNKNEPLIDYVEKNKTSLNSETISGDLWSFNDLLETRLKQAIEIKHTNSLYKWVIIRIRNYYPLKKTTN